MANNESTNIFVKLDNDIKCLDLLMIKQLTSAPKISKKKFNLSCLNIEYSKSYESLKSDSTSAPSVLSEEKLLETYFKFSLEGDSDEEIEKIFY